MYSLADNVLRIVRSLHQLTPVSITNARVNWRTVDQVVDVSPHFTNSPVRQPAYHQIRLHSHIQHSGRSGFVKTANSFQPHRLRQSSGKTIEYETVFAIRLGNSFLHHA